MVRRFFRYYVFYYVAMAMAMFSGWLLLDLTDGNTFAAIVGASISFVFLWMLAMTTEETNRWIDANQQR